MSLHVDQRKCLLEEDDQHAAGNTVLIEPIFVHVRLLREHERSVLKTYYAKLLETRKEQRQTGPISPRQVGFARRYPKSVPAARPLPPGQILGTETRLNRVS